MTQTSEFLGRKLAKHLQAAKGDGDAGSAAAAAAGAGGSDDEGDEDVVGRVRRKDGAEPLDLEVLDDRDLYQHLLKVRTKALECCMSMSTQDTCLSSFGVVCLLKVHITRMLVLHVGRAFGLCWVLCVLLMLPSTERVDSNLRCWFWGLRHMV